MALGYSPVILHVNYVCAILTMLSPSVSQEINSAKAGGVMSACSETTVGGKQYGRAMPMVHCACCAGTKQELKDLYDDRQVIQFAEFYPVGHR